MTIRETDANAFRFAFGRKGNRTRPEQLVGLGIYLSISFAFLFISGMTTHPLSLFYAVFLALGMWVLWRSFSLTLLKLELSVFLAQFLFQVVWSIGFFLLKQSLLVLVALLLLSCNTLLAMLLFWKKERLSGMLYLFPLLWVFYLAFVNMITCMRTE